MVPDQHTHLILTPAIVCSAGQLRPSRASRSQSSRAADQRPGPCPNFCPLDGMGTLYNVETM